MENLKSIYGSRPIGMNENFRYDAARNCTDLTTDRDSKSSLQIEIDK